MGVAAGAVRAPAAGPDRGDRPQRRPPHLAGLPVVVLSRSAATRLALAGRWLWPRLLGLRPALHHASEDADIEVAVAARSTPAQSQASAAATTSPTALIATACGVTTALSRQS